jgi:ABC transporter DrrB family efflux protein
MTTITAHAPADVVAPAVPGRLGAAYPIAAVQTAKRTILQFFRTPQLLVMGTISGAMFLFVFRYIFGGAIDTGTGASYVDFLVPGFLVSSILWIGMAATPGVAEDANSGVHDRFRSLPITRSAVVVGRSLADLSLTAWGMLITTLLGFAVGFRVGGGVGEAVLAFALLLLGAYVFSWLFITLGLTSGSAQAAQGSSLIATLFLTFVSSAYVPTNSMPGWMQPVAEHQPMTALANAVRSLLLGGTDAAGVGHSTGYWVGLSVAWCAGILVLFSTLAVARFSRRR